MQDLLRTIHRTVGASHHELSSTAHKALRLAGRQASWQLRGMPRLRHLAEAEFQVYSQWGEDGILEWLFQTLPLRSRRFIEFGVENYRESNTRFLLQQRNLQGLVIDSSADHVRQIQQDPLYWRHDLTAVTAFITVENVNRLFVEAGFTGELALLSIDVDGNDYWLWQAIEVVDPHIVVCEYNALFGDVHPLSIPYDPAFNRFQPHHSGLHAGCSLPALIALGRSKGYTLVGTTSQGLNAFFVKDCHVPLLRERLEEFRAFPSLFRNSCDANRRLTHTPGLKRLELIRDCPIQRVDTGEITTLAGLEPVYSDDWAGYILGTDRQGEERKGG